jgi:hypothetical protein
MVGIEAASDASLASLLGGGAIFVFHHPSFMAAAG